MKVNISGIFTNPEFYFDLSDNFLKLFKEGVGNNIFDKNLTDAAEFFEIYLRTNGKEENSRAVKLSKRKGKYLSFDFWIAYPKTVIALREGVLTEINLLIFTQEMMLCLREALASFGLAENVFEQTEKEICAKLIENPDFYRLNNAEQLIESRKLAKQILAEADEILKKK